MGSDKEKTQKNSDTRQTILMKEMGKRVCSLPLLPGNEQELCVTVPCNMHNKIKIIVGNPSKVHNQKALNLIYLAFGHVQKITRCI